MQVWYCTTCYITFPTEEVANLHLKDCMTPKTEPHPKSLGAVKDNKNKPRHSLLPYSALNEAAKAFTHGEAKYGSFNYKEGFEWSKLIDATYRHPGAFNSGIDHDDETSFNHIGHALASLMMLMDHYHNGYGKDDRYKKPE